MAGAAIGMGDIFGEDAMAEVDLVDDGFFEQLMADGPKQSQSRNKQCPQY